MPTGRQSVLIEALLQGHFGFPLQRMAVNHRLELSHKAHASERLHGASCRDRVPGPPLPCHSDQMHYDENQLQGSSQSCGLGLGGTAAPALIISGILHAALSRQGKL